MRRRPRPVSSVIWAWHANPWTPLRRGRGDVSEPRPLGAIEENTFDLIAADFICLARIASLQRGSGHGRATGQALIDHPKNRRVMPPIAPADFENRKTENEIFAKTRIAVSRRSWRDHAADMQPTCAVESVSASLFVPVKFGS